MADVFNSKLDFPKLHIRLAIYGAKNWFLNPVENG